MSSERMSLKLAGPGNVRKLVAARYTVEWNQVMAATLVATAPAPLLLAWQQRYLVGGLTLGAVKERIDIGESTQGMAPVPFLRCMLAVAHLYALPPSALPAIQAVEGGAPGVVHHNRNGTEDLGVMQVNTFWVMPIARASGLSAVGVWSRLIGDPCFNITAAGAILRVYLNETHDLMRAIGDYHSHTPVLNRRYQLQVLAAARRLFVTAER